MAGVAAAGDRAVLFPEGVALAWGAWVMRRPDWSRLGPRLGLAPVLCAACGLAAAILLPSRLEAELAALTAAAAVSAALRTSVGPAFSAAVLPAVAGIRSGWYLLSVCVIVTAVLAGIYVLDRFLPLPPGGTEPPGSPPGPACVVTWAACAAWLSIAAGLALPLAAAAPPLLASTFEWVSGRPKGARAGARLGAVITIAWAAGAAAARQLSLLPAAAVAMLIAVTAMHAAQVTHPPAVAVALVPLVLGAPATWGGLLAGACSVAAAVTVLYVSAAAALLLTAGRRPPRGALAPWIHVSGSDESPAPHRNTQLE